MTPTPPTDLLAALASLASALESATFPLPAPTQDAAQANVARALWSIREYLEPRLRDLGAPTVAVLIGSTGAGKSTLLNSLAGEAVADAGAVRPTTRVPTAWTHHRNAGRYSGDLLPSFRGDDRPLRVTEHDDRDFAEITVIDTPDVDSIVADHRVIAEEVLAVADLCVYVTTAQRYADAVPWEILRGVRDRRLPLIVVLNRVPASGADEVEADLRARLAAEGLPTHGQVLTVVPIAEQPIATVGPTLSEADVAPVREALLRAAGPGTRDQLIHDAVTGTIGEVLGAADRAVADLVDERATADSLLQVAADAYEEQTHELLTSIEEGRLIRSEVVARWQDFVGTGELLRVLTEGAGRVRGWARKVFGGRDQAARTVTGEARSQLADAIARRADRAAAAVAGAWELSPSGAGLLSGELWRADAATADRAADVVSEWLGELAVLIEREGGGRRRIAQAASVGVNAAAVVLMLAVFSQTGGLTGAEVGITAGAAALQQRVLEHLFGSAAARALVQEASARLRADVTDILLQDRQRFDATVWQMSTAPDAADAVADARAVVGLEARTLTPGHERG